MGIFSKLFRSQPKRRSSSSRRRRFPAKTLAPVAEIVEQGLLVDEVALRMSVKNTIIMNALRHGVDYDEAEIHQLVRTATLRLVAERKRDAKHIKRVRDEIREYGRSAWQEGEYGSGDSKTLKHRQEVYEQLSEALTQRAGDAVFVEAIAKRARDEAWVEIGDSLKERASHPYYSGGASAEYQRAREERIQRFIDEDIQALLQPEKPGQSEKNRFRKNRS